MKFVIVLACLFAVALARPGNDVEIKRSESDVNPEGFSFGYETSDGTSHDSEGKVKDIGSEHEAIQVHGSYSWHDDEGKPHTITYTADENGYVAHGEDVPHA